MSSLNSSRNRSIGSFEDDEEDDISINLHVENFGHNKASDLKKKASELLSRSCSDVDSEEEELDYQLIFDQPNMLDLDNNESQPSPDVIAL